MIKYVDEITQECPIGTYKNVSGSDRSLCAKCPSHELPHRAEYISIRGTSSLYYDSSVGISSGTFGELLFFSIKSY